MSFIKLGKEQLVNLHNSLGKELMHSNQKGVYSSSTIVNANTRKYHGLLVAPIPKFNNKKFVLLSSLDISIIQNNEEINLGVRQYSHNYYDPKGHIYLRSMEINTIPKLTYRIGGVILTFEKLLVEKSEQVLIKLTMEKANADTIVKITPFLAFREIHSLIKANQEVNTKITKIKRGIKTQLYKDFPYLHLQISKNGKFVYTPHWYYNIEYFKEQRRGYEYKEDLIVPGYFELSLKEGENIIVSASTFEDKPNKLTTKFTNELKRYNAGNNFITILTNTAKQFIIKEDQGYDIVAGLPWYKTRLRDSLISLFGLTYSSNNKNQFRTILNTLTRKIKNKLSVKTSEILDTSDELLWYFWTIQKYAEQLEDTSQIWKTYKEIFIQILNLYKRGTDQNVKMHNNHLLFAYKINTPLTWMDSTIENRAIIPRYGYTVEVNALWHNAICFLLELAYKNNDDKVIQEWGNYPKRIKKSFIETFWDEEKTYLADSVFNNVKDWSVSPNQILACSLDFSPISNKQKRQIINIADKELLTQVGLRTLSPNSPNYVGKYSGNQFDRERAMHQGTVHIWLLGAYVETCLKIYKKLPKKIINILGMFENEITESGIGTLSEVYNGDPPFKGKGAYSFAMNVAEVLRINMMLNKT